MEKHEIGKVTNYFAKIEVAAIKLTDTLKVGDTISIVGAHTDFEQNVDSIQIERESIDQAGAGQEVGIKVRDRVRGNDIVYKVTGE